MRTPGARLGALEVLGPLGAGGMGEVYRARDTRLGRDVAVKVLPDAFAADPNRRLHRFEREARLLAALNHPGIAAIYGLEQSDGRPLLVLELMEGPTLAERLRRGRLPIREALQVAKQIAEALEAAHEKGIIHRDLKPSNIKLTPEGKVKLLDFGLAKALEPESAPTELSKHSTETPATSERAVLGTAPYMSPEQARGERIDRRTDVGLRINPTSRGGAKSMYNRSPDPARTASSRTTEARTRSGRQPARSSSTGAGTA